MIVHQIGGLAVLVLAAAGMSAAVLICTMIGSALSLLWLCRVAWNVGKIAAMFGFLVILASVLAVHQ